MTRFNAALGLGSSLLVAVGLTGCGTGIATTTVAPAPFQSAGLTGRLMGGQQPVAGVTIQLYTAGTGSYGAAAVPLGPSVLTSSGGNFTYPAFTCPAPDASTFLVGTGGQPIAAANGNPAVTNNNLAMMTVLGRCDGVASSFSVVNELTTVAAVYSLSQFMTSPTNVGAPGSNLTGLQNAFATFSKLVNATNGQLGGPNLPQGAVLPAPVLNTLADVMQQCINSNGLAGGNNSPCAMLFNLTPGVNNATPTDTITSMLNVAQNPGRNVPQINQLRPASPVFTPTVSVNSPPTAWTVAVTHTAGGSLANATGMAADQGGNIWITSGSNNSVIVLGNTGSVQGVIPGGAGISNPSAVAIDQQGNGWITNAGNNSLTEVVAATSGIASFTGGGLNAPNGVAIDASNNVWVTNPNGTVSAFASNGNPLSSTGYTGAGVTNPVGLAINPR